MTPERWSRIKALFAAALEVPVAERDAFLSAEKTKDPELVAEVLSLLDSHEQPGEFLEPVNVTVRNAAFVAQEISRIGERVGAYRIVGELGSGGMGDVFKAVRDDDQYRAEVAIKIMRTDARNPIAEQRFKNERQILAALDHPNISRLLDGGTTSAGVPYVVMELVAGVSIDHYCEARSLSSRERVQLFLQVCAAVSYAHQHLVVHRDLKPNNMLVTTEGTLKLLDFGIAKLVELDETTGADTEETRTQLRAMTLEYASPEQVSGGAVTTVSDVYSLGVVLYRLLTGQSPYRVRTNDAARVAEILSDTSPTRPSQIENRTRTPIDSDLDHILLRALRKEPTKRYGSVEQFANDLRNYLNGLPVAARRGTMAYRGGKFVRRNKASIAAVIVVVLSLMIGFGFSVREARIADRERAVAQRHFDSVRSLANTLMTDLYDEINDLPGAMKARTRIAQTAQSYLDALSKESSGDLKLQEELATAYRKLGDIQGGQYNASGGDSKSALDSYQKSAALLENIIAAEPGNQHAGAGLAKSLVLQSRVLLVTQGPEAAVPFARRGVALGETMQGGFSSENDGANTLSVSYRTLAEVLAATQQIDEAMALFDKAVVVAESYAAAHPDDVQGLKQLRNAYANAAIGTDPRQSAQATFDRLIGLMRKSLAVSEQLLAKDPTSAEHLTRLAEQRLNIADALYNVGDYRASADMFRLAAPALTKAAEEKADARAQLANAMVQAGLGGSLAKLGETTEAISRFAAAERDLLELLRLDPENLTSGFMLAQVEIQRGAMFAHSAKQSRSDRSAQLDYWHKARASLISGLARIRKVNEHYPLAGSEKVVLDVGIATLAEVEAALANGHR